MVSLMMMQRKRDVIVRAVAVALMVPTPFTDLGSPMPEAEPAISSESQTPSSSPSAQRKTFQNLKTWTKNLVDKAGVESSKLGARLRNEPLIEEVPFSKPNLEEIIVSTPVPLKKRFQAKPRLAIINSPLPTVKGSSPLSLDKLARENPLEASETISRVVGGRALSTVPGTLQARFLQKVKKDINKLVGDRPILACYAGAGNLPVVEMLLQMYKADPNARSADGMQPLDMAIRTCNVEVVEVLLKAGALVNRRVGGETPLMSAIQCNEFAAPIVSLLLKSGADPNLTGSTGKTALSTASALGRIDLMELLEKRGAVVSPKKHQMGFKPESALVAAITNGQLSSLKKLLPPGTKLSNTGTSELTGAVVALIGKALDGDYAAHRTLSYLVKEGSGVLSPETDFNALKLHLYQAASRLNAGVFLTLWRPSQRALSSNTKEVTHLLSAAMAGYRPDESKKSMSNRAKIVEALGVSPSSKESNKAFLNRVKAQQERHTDQLFNQLFDTPTAPAPKKAKKGPVGPLHDDSEATRHLEKAARETNLNWLKANLEDFEKEQGRKLTRAELKRLRQAAFSSFKKNEAAEVSEDRIEILKRLGGSLPVRITDEEKKRYKKNAAEMLSAMYSYEQQKNEALKDAERLFSHGSKQLTPTYTVKPELGSYDTARTLENVQLPLPKQRSQKQRRQSIGITDEAKKMVKGSPKDISDQLLNEAEDLREKKDWVFVDDVEGTYTPPKDKWTQKLKNLFTFKRRQAPQPRGPGFFRRTWNAMKYPFVTSYKKVRTAFKRTPAPSS